MQDENAKIHEVKYEALVHLIAQNQEEQKERWHRFDKGFDEFKLTLKEDMGELKAYNKKQNGNIAHALSRITDMEIRESAHVINCPLAEKVEALEKAEATRVENCPLNEKVSTLEDSNKRDTAIKKWIQRGLVTASIVFGIFWILFQVFIRIFDIAPK